MITMIDWNVEVPEEERFIGYVDDHAVDVLTIKINETEPYKYRLDMIRAGEKNIANLTHTGDTLTLDLTRSILRWSGVYVCQIRGVNGGQTRRSNEFYLYVRSSLNVTRPIPEVPPSILEQFEALLDEATSKFNQYIQAVPTIGPNGNWWFGDIDTGIEAGGSGSGFNGEIVTEEDIDIMTQINSDDLLVGGGLVDEEDIDIITQINSENLLVGGGLVNESDIDILTQINSDGLLVGGGLVNESDIDTLTQINSENLLVGGGLVDESDIDTLTQMNTEESLVGNTVASTSDIDALFNE